MSVSFRQEIQSPVLEEEITKIASSLIDTDQTRLESISVKLLIVMDKHLDFGVHMTIDEAFPCGLSVDPGFDFGERWQALKLRVFEQ